MTACPFELCSASVAMVPERSAPGPNPDAVVRVPQHALQPDSEFGLCPASLLLYPLDDYSRQQLATMAESIDRMHRDRDRHASEPAASGPSPEAGEHRWFRDHNPSGYQTNQPGYNAEPTIPQVLLPPVSPVREALQGLGPARPATPTGNTTSGGSTGVSSVQEVRAAISAAGEVCAQVSGQLFALESEAQGALAALNMIRETSIDTLGAPEVAMAIEKIAEAAALFNQAIEIGTTYKATL